MSTITNEPILLDSTGQSLLDEMKVMSSHLAMIAEERRSEIYSSMSQIANLVRSGDVARNAKIFPIGDQIVMPWKDMDDSAHDTDETAYQVAWDIVHHGDVELQSGRIVPGMFIQMHLCSAYGMQFSAPQAFAVCPDGLTAGTYYFTLNAKYDAIPANSILEFTLTQAVPANGRIKMATDLSVTTWASGGTAAIETVTAAVVGSSSGTNLGVTGTNGLNTVPRMKSGHNRWSTSAVRQYLNKSGTDWWVSQGDFDIRPDQYNKHGFMTGFDSEFLNAIKPVKVTTALNTVEGFADSTENTFDAFFLPSLQQMNVTPQLANAEGDVFEYWRERLGTNTYVGTGSSNVFDAFNVPAINANSAQNVRLRSADRGGANGTWAVYTSGYVSNGYAAGTANRFSPVCVIC